MIEIKIDDRVYACEKGEYLLDIAKRNHIDIPTLCHHPGMDGLASCRLCIVEVVERGWSKIVVSCVYPVDKPIEVYPNSERVRRDRAAVLMLLALRAPESPEIKDLCEKYGALDGSRFAAIENEKCVMCGLCAQVCGAIGTGAIATVGRGTEKKIATPYDEPSDVCFGCLSCAKVCPTGAISFAENPTNREIWGRRFPLVFCQKCGTPLGTYAEVQYAAKKAGHPGETLCTHCRQAAMSDSLAHTYGEV
ncbi:2Fe-2S iron-sulfur cluster-binding protein [Eubacterium aggregans]|uniref:2Fe-2S iron-sulfur cluster-binding protein n=2 Tax=Eubacterium aggregans TaxID=81409 RepID=UPI003F35DB41